jgi:hypothetical protein
VFLASHSRLISQRFGNTCWVSRRSTWSLPCWSWPILRLLHSAGFCPACYAVESAFQVFSKEGYRTSNRELSQSQALAYRIAAEEFEHERLLRVLRGCCPVPGDLVSILQRTRGFFSGWRTGILQFILPGWQYSTRRDEACHMKFSRQHECRLGAYRGLLDCIAIRVRAELLLFSIPWLTHLKIWELMRINCFSESEGTFLSLIARLTRQLRVKEPLSSCMRCCP